MTGAWARRRPLIAGLVCGGAHALCFALMFPPVFLWGLAFVALSPLMWLAGELGNTSPQGHMAKEPHGAEASQGNERRAARRVMRRALLGVFLAVTPMWAFHHLWIARVTPVGFPVLIVYLSIYAPLFVWLGARWKRRVGDGWRFWLALPVIWIGLEMFRGAVMWDGYAWFFVGHPLVGSPGLATTAEVIGAIGVSLLAAVMNCAPALFFSFAMSGGGAPRLPPARSTAIIAAALLVVAGAFALGVVTHASRVPVNAVEEMIREKPALRARARTIAVVQTNVPQDNRAAWRFEQRLADFEKFCALTREAAGVAAAVGHGASAATRAAIEALIAREAADKHAPSRSRLASSVESANDVESATPPPTETPDLIVWPETMFPGLALNEEAVAVERAEQLFFPGDVPSTAFVDRLLALEREVGTPMLVGAVAMEGLRIVRTALPDGSASLMPVPQREFNSAFVIEGGRVRAERYDKVKLTPFGEYMPYISWSDWLEGRLLALGAGGMRFNLSAGRDYRALEVSESGDRKGESGNAGLGIATPICFEATMSGVCRRLVYAGGWNARRKADVLINMTNDGWFGESPGGRENHLLAARWRCVELATPMVRAANTGVSCAIDASGRVTTSLEKKTEGVMRAVVALPTSGAPTLYARTGDVVGWTCLGATGLMGALTFVRRRGRTGGGTPM